MGIALLGIVAFLFCAIAVAQVRKPKHGHGPPHGYRLFFEDHFDHGSLGNFVIGDDNTGSISVNARTGTATLRIPPGARDAREELSINEPNQHFSDGDRFIIEAERWLPPGTMPGGPGSHFTFVQFKGDEGRYPMVSSEYARFSRSGTGFYVQDKNRPTTKQSYKIANYRLGTWHTERIFVAVSNRGRGGYAFTVDGRRAAKVSGVNTLEPVDSYGFIKIGAYGQPDGKAVEVKLRNVRVYVPK